MNDNCRSPCKHTGRYGQTLRGTIDKDIMKQWITGIGLINTDCRLVALTEWFLLLMNYRLMCVTSVSPWSWPALPVYHSIPQLVTTMTSFCSVLMKSPRVWLTLCCSSASTSQAPWVSLSRWKPHHWWRSVYCLWQLAFRNPSRGVSNVQPLLF